MKVMILDLMKNESFAELCSLGAMEAVEMKELKMNTVPDPTFVF